MITNDYLTEIQDKGYLILKDSDFSFDERILKKVYELFHNVRSNPESYFKKYRNHLKPSTMYSVDSLDDFNKIIKEHESFKQESNGTDFWFQLWRFGEVPDNFKSFIKVYLKTIVNKIYGIVINQSDLFVSNLTSFTKGCGIVNHKDQPHSGGRLCVILSYFSDEWKEEYGGILKINNNTISIPTLGNIVVLDFTKNNVEHEVTEVLVENKHRLSLTTFVEYKNYNDN